MELVALLDAVDDLTLEALLGGGEGSDGFVELIVEALALGGDSCDTLTAEVVHELLSRSGARLP